VTSGGWPAARLMEDDSHGGYDALVITFGANRDEFVIGGE
jgi:hypothetical protein